MSYLPTSTHADDINPKLLNDRWPAAWCRHADLDFARATGIYLFRKQFTLTQKPQKYLVHISADSRYRLHVNGEPVAWGPARNDLEHWEFDTHDLSPWLRAGDNALAVEVTFLGELAPVAQIWFQHGLIVQGNTDAEAAVNTPAGWRAHRHEGYRFTTEDSAALKAYCVVGPSEILDLSRHPWGWTDARFDDSAWPEASLVGRNYGVPYGLVDGESPWWLMPRPIPTMEETPQRWQSIARSEGVAVPDGLISGKASLQIPANNKAVLLLDHGVETTAFPELTVSKGRGASVHLSYAEAMMTDVNHKGHRDETQGRQLIGYGDTWLPDGGDARILRPTWWRTFRFCQLTIETADQPLTLDNLQSIYTGYPFEVKCRFTSPQMPEADKLQEIGWRTLRLCAHETFFDCPYYEQLQYVGDTRIQCLISLYTSGDARLYRNAIWQIHNSRIAEGLTQSRYPSRMRQVIPPFSLWYIGMVHDYWRHVPGDDEFIQSLLVGVHGVLAWFRERLRADGLLGGLQFWNFVDWTTEWDFGRAPGVQEGGSSNVTLQHALALREASELEAAFGNAGVADQLAREHDDVVAAVAKHCYDAADHRVADTPARETFSQHASILFILANDGMPPAEKKAIGQRLLSDTSLTQATFYFRFYLTRALVAAGLGDEYLATLGPWQDMVNLGLTTWAEKPEPTRSDCHAWSSAPNYELLATVLGVTPAGPGFGSVKISPHLGHLTEAAGQVPHPRGMISVSLKRDGDKLHSDIKLPPGVKGELHWNGEVSQLT